LIHFYECDPKHGEGVAKAIGRKIEEVVKKEELVGVKFNSVESTRAALLGLSFLLLRLLLTSVLPDPG
jgi:hypothetical protein